MHQTIKVSSLNYEVKIVNDFVQIGCQKITEDDAKKLADFILNADYKKSKVPSGTVIKIPNLKIGRVVAEALIENGISVHKIGLGIDEFDENFENIHKYYHIKNGVFSGSGVNPTAISPISVNEFFEIIKD